MQLFSKPTGGKPARGRLETKGSATTSSTVSAKLIQGITNSFGGALQALGEGRTGKSSKASSGRSDVDKMTEGEVRAYAKQLEKDSDRSKASSRRSSSRGRSPMKVKK